jgi:hypothetical protein
MAEVDEHASAFSGRWANHIFKINGRWEDPAEDEANIAWVRELFEDVAEHVRDGVYVNYLARDDQDRIEAAYGEEIYRRLREVKAHWGPDNRLCVNQNIRPASD